MPIPDQSVVEPIPALYCLQSRQPLTDQSRTPCISGGVSVRYSESLAAPVSAFLLPRAANAFIGRQNTP